MDDNEYIEFNGEKLKIPNIALGKVVPPKIEKMILEEERQKEERLAEEKRELEKERRQFRHDWKIAIFSAFAGALLARPLWDGIDIVIALLHTVLLRQ